jgi:hypothetical protein
MTYLAFGLSLFIAAMGGLGMVSPARLLSLMRRLQKTPGGLYVAAVVRLVLGVALLLVAPTSRAPDLVRVIGVLAVVAALMTPVVGLARWGRLVDWWSGQASLVIRAWAAIPLGFGLYLAWAVLA